MGDPVVLSKTLVDKAGVKLRRFALHRDVDPTEFRRALDVVTTFRATWAAPPQPLAKVSMGLRSLTGRVVSGKPRVSQRLKRLHRIVEKLSREEHRTMRLSQMEDVGGCRVVVPSLSELWSLRERVVGTWQDYLRDEHDYIAHPKKDGYRGIHLVVMRDDRLVEIQLRTQRQHLWATQVERLEMTRGEALRGGHGRKATQNALRGLADAFAQAESVQEAPWETLRAQLELWLAELTDKG